jgi:hypothetical protein
MCPEATMTFTGDGMEQHSNDTAGPTEISEPRRIASWLIRAIGFLIGAAALSLYVFLMWTLPPDWQHMSSGQVVRGLIPTFIFVPLAILIGPFWLANWIASYIDKRRLTK